MRREGYFQDINGKWWDLHSLTGEEIARLKKEKNNALNLKNKKYIEIKCTKCHQPIKVQLSFYKSQLNYGKKIFYCKSCHKSKYTNINILFDNYIKLAKNYGPCINHPEREVAQYKGLHLCAICRQ